MVKHMLDLLLKINAKGRVPIYFQMGEDMTVIGKMICEMAMVF